MELQPAAAFYNLPPMSSSPHPWNFFRTGGLDQVALTTGADLLALDQLDQKLWVALSCPVRGLELDEKTLALIDTDADGRIRVPELLAAVQWAAARLNEPGDMLRGADALPLAAINVATTDGKIILASAKKILAQVGKKDALALTVAEAADTAKIFSASPLHGDGVVPPEATDDAVVQALIKDIITCAGGTVARTGLVGVTAERIDAFFADLAAFVAWVETRSTTEIAILGEATNDAVAAIRAVREKVDDYFARCRLAAFDGRAIAALNRSEADFAVVAAKQLKLTVDEAAGFPLARIEPGRALPLFEGVNPAWAAGLAALQAKAIAPIWGAAKLCLTESEWVALGAKFAPYEKWLAGKTGGTVEKLGLGRVKEILAGPGRAALAKLVAQDKALEPEFRAIGDVERLVRYHRDLRTLLHNFVNFADFYSSDRRAVFQAGTLYLDSRSTELCLRVDAPSPLAAASKVYIAYCACTRAGSPPMNIAACFTQGDSDYLFVGRHGVFYDRAGRDWDAVVTSLVDQPISIHQAFLSPYKKFLRFIEEQLAKRAAAADADASGQLAAAAAQTANVDRVKPEPRKIDIGTVAALGVAVSGITGAFGLIMGAFFGLGVWMPVGVIVLILAISGPSMIIAWLKLRQRTLGPLLEGNGWAINGRVAINIPFGTALTDLAALPPGARRSLEDPYEDKAAARQKRRATALIVVLLIAAGAIWIRWDATKHRDGAGQPRYFWQDRPASAGSAPVAAPAPAAATAKP